MILSWSVVKAGVVDFDAALVVVLNVAGLEVAVLEDGGVDCARRTTGAKNRIKRILFRLAARGASKIWLYHGTGNICCFCLRPFGEQVSVEIKGNEGMHLLAPQPCQIIFLLQSVHSMRKGIFLPRRNSSLCSRKCCGFWKICEQEFGDEVPS